MKLLKLEMKRVLKTRSTWILLSMSLLFTILLAYLPTTFESISYMDEAGNIVEMTGIKAIAYQKELQKDISGSITSEKLYHAVEEVQACLKEYGAENTYELPEEVYLERILPYSALLPRIREAFADPDTGMAPSIAEIDLKDVGNFYDACNKRLEALMQMEQKEHPAAQQHAAAMYTQVDMPFTFYPITTGNAMDYQTLLILLVMLFCVVITAPVFSSDYQTGADDILRCTKFGRSRLGIIKIISAFLICGTAFCLCIILYILISNSLFGWECTKTSMQIQYSVSSLKAFTIGELQWFIALASFLSLLATISFTLFLSSRCRDTIAAQSVSILGCLLPLFVYFAAPETAGNWIRSLLPSGGLILQSSYLYELTSLNFLNIGQISLWLPDVMLAAAIIEIPVFIGLTIYSYARHRT